MKITDPGTIPGRNCEFEDPEIWFVEEGSYTHPVQAARICSGCPALDVCLEWALAHETGVGHSGRSGIYGGMTPRQRAKIAAGRRETREPKPITHGTEAGYRAHRRRGEVACADCVAGASLAKRLREERNGRRGAA